MKISNLSDAAKYAIGSQLIKLCVKLSSPLEKKNGILLGSLFLKIINDNKLSEIPDEILKDILKKSQLTPEKKEFFAQQKETSIAEYMSETGIFSDGILASTFPSPLEYATDEITSKFAKEGLGSFINEEDAIQFLKNKLREEALEPCHVKNNQMAGPYVSQLGVLVTTLKQNNIVDLNTSFEKIRNLQGTLPTNKFLKHESTLKLIAEIEKGLSLIEESSKEEINSSFSTAYKK